MSKRKLPELLSPAGDLQCLKAAVFAGADAVYLGMKKYNARAFAGNFDEEELREGMRLCRIHGVKVYITFNTLVHQKEFEDTLNYAARICREFCPDGAIVQSIGFAKRLHEACGVPIVASTQMALHSAEGTEQLKKIGVFKAVMARELTLAEIKDICRNSAVETEIFIHGAICVCKSGGCYMSSMIGGRSGNRGECAQPCRLPYGNKYPLSLKDMCLAEHITEIIEAGVSSLKIEGRMKEPAYVYGTTSVYRRLLDENRNASPSELSYLSDLFSRSGFTDAYFTGELSEKMFGVRTDDDKRRTSSALADIREKKISVSIDAEINENRCKLKLEGEGVSVEASYGGAARAESRALAATDVKERLSKLGNTAFESQKTELKLGDGLFLPLSAINGLRRDAVALFEDALILKNTPEYDRIPHSDAKKNTRSPRHTVNNLQTKKPIDTTMYTSTLVYNVRFEGERAPDEEMFSPWEDKVSFFDIPLADTDSLKRYVKRYPRKTRAMLPVCVFPNDLPTVADLIVKAKAVGVEAFLCHGFSQAELCESAKIYADFDSNLCDVESLNFYKDMGFSGAYLSPELKDGALRYLSRILPASIIAYGRLPLMHTRACIIESASGKHCERRSKNTCKSVLCDRKGASFPVYREFSHSNRVFNSVPIYLLDKKERIRSLGVTEIGFIFTDESPKRISDILSKAETGAIADCKITRGYFC